jgi:AbrB family looped-hinge helix DNA binding protein
MAKLSTTKMSSKGQVVIPEEIRDRLGLKAGIQFVVIGEKDVVILKALTAPSMDEFDDLVKKARKQARKSGMKRSDIDRTTSKVRGRR